MEKLNCKSLMIGDWVYRHDCYSKVKEIKETGIIGLDPLRGIISFEELEPIPLTTEILEKNGWEECNWDTDDDVQYGYDYGLFYVTWWRNVKLLSCYFEDKNAGLSYEMISELPTKHVHQLQHALRLCGIDKEIEL